MSTDIPDHRIYRGPYILATVNGELRFVPAKQNENKQWVALTPEEYEEAKYAAH